jgi:hypothetical protein
MMSIQGHTAVLSVALLLWAGLAQPGFGQSPKPHEQALKEHLIEIPAGSIVEVKLENKQKLRGKLGAVNDTGFELQTVRDGKIVTQNILLNDVKSIKAIGKGMSTGWKIGLGALAGIGAFFVILIAVAAAHGWY